VVLLTGAHQTGKTTLVRSRVLYKDGPNNPPDGG
jgi:hypothetical protein